jgi:hypothetical protein
MHTVAGKERDKDNIFCVGQAVTGGDERLFFEENTMDGRIGTERPNRIHVLLNRNARVLVLRGAMAGHKEGNLPGMGSAGKRELLNYCSSARQQDLGHTRVCADGAAINEHLIWAPDYPLGLTASGLWETQGARDNAFTEIAFTHEKRDEEDPPGGDPGQHIYYPGFLFPESLMDAGKAFSPAQFGGMLKNRRTRLRIQC